MSPAGYLRNTANGTRSLLYSGYSTMVRIQGSVLTEAQIAANGAMVGARTDQGRGRLVSLPAGEDATHEIAR